MSAIPENEVTQADLAEWYRLNEELRKIKASEILLRNKIFKGMFKDPVEGTNTVPLADGWVLKGKRVIGRDIDLSSLQAYTVKDAEERTPLERANISIDRLIKWKPELVLKEYRQLSSEQLQVFDNILVIKDGTPSLEIVLPAKNKTSES